MPAPVAAATKCANPDALGISHLVVEPPPAAPGFGYACNTKQFDFLTDHEIVLTFDDGPWPTHARRAQGACG